MDPILSRLLGSWDWRIDLIIVLALAGTIYTWGWLHLRRIKQKLNKPKHQLQKQDNWRLVAYWGGLLVLVLALMSPIDPLGWQLFTFHMIQHLLLIMIAPPLLLLANPFPVMLWGLPIIIRQPVAALFKQTSPFRQILQMATTPGVVWLVFVATYLGWHDPNAYNAALQFSWVHDLEHITFFISGMLFWWQVIDAAPYIHKRLPFGVRVGYLLSAIPPNMLAGATIAFSSQPIYTHYTTVPRTFGLTAIEDQMIGGVIMWVPGSMMYILGVLILMARWFQIEENKPPLPEDKWATDEAMLAPGWDKN